MKAAFRVLIGVAAFTALFGAASDAQAEPEPPYILEEGELPPVTPPLPPPPPSPTGWPDASNTGIANCGNWSGQRSGTVVTSSNGQVIQNLDITGTIQVRHDNVTVRCVRINAAGADRAISDFGNGSFRGLVVEDSEIFGTDGGSGGGRGKCIFSLGSSYTLRRVNMHSCGDAIHISGGNAPVVVEDSYCHDLKEGNGEHNDCFQLVNGGPAVLRHNTFIAPYHQNAAVNVTSNFGQVNDVLVENNRLGGGGFVVYVLDQWQSGSNNCPTNVRFIGNRFIPGSYKYGTTSFGSSERSCGPGSIGWVWLDNISE